MGNDTPAYTPASQLIRSFSCIALSCALPGVVLRFVLLQSGPRCRTLHHVSLWTLDSNQGAPSGNGDSYVLDSLSACGLNFWTSGCLFRRPNEGESACGLRVEGDGPAMVGQAALCPASPARALEWRSRWDLPVAGKDATHVVRTGLEFNWVAGSVVCTLETRRIVWDTACARDDLDDYQVSAGTGVLY